MGGFRLLDEAWDAMLSDAAQAAEWFDEKGGVWVGKKGIFVLCLF